MTPKNKTILIGLIAGLVFMTVIFAVNSINQASANNQSKKQSPLPAQNDVNKKDDKLDSVQTEKAKIVKTLPDQIQLNTLFFGDVFWGRYVDDWAKASELKNAYPFSGLNTFDKTNYDTWIAGLECPITSTYLTSKAQDAQLKFSCPTQYTPEAAKWFDAFTLANNHTDNMEEVQGLKQTRENLESNKIQYFGHFDNSVKSDICEITSFKGKSIFNQVTPEENKDNSDFYIPLALCGFHNLYRLPKEDELAVISKYAKYLPTIVLPHQGKEYTYSADSLQQSYNKRMIDLGADAVIGNHVHSVQNTEAYKGKLIVYSLGNFIFDQQRTPQVTQAIGANLNFTFENNQNMQSWLKFSETCKKFKDDCLEIAKQKKLDKPKFKIQYDIVGSDNSGKLAKKSSDKVFKDLLQRTNWEVTKKGLTQ